MVSAWAIAVQLHRFAGPLLTLAYPLYASISAIESPNKEDDTQWLTYWVLFSFLQLLEFALERILSWVPFWYTLKLVAIGWLVLPPFHGAAFLYENYVKKFYYRSAANYGGDGNPEKLGQKVPHVSNQMSPEAVASVSAFIEEFGPGAFDSVISAMDIGLERRKKSPPSPFAAEPTRYPQPPPGAGEYTGSPPEEYTGSPPGAEATGDTGPAPAARMRRSETFRQSIKQPVKLLKTGLHSLESRRSELRAKMKTSFVT